MAKMTNVYLWIYLISTQQHADNAYITNLFTNQCIQEQNIWNIDITLYECVLLITNLFSNILIFLQHLVISYITCLNTGTLVIKKYAHSDKYVHICTNTHTHTQSSHYTIIYHFHFHTRTLFSPVAFDTHHARYSWQNKNTQYYQYWQHTPVQVCTVQWLICPPS